MCGIVGIFDTKGPSVIDKNILSKMNETLFHRGPDEGGIHVEPGVGLGHRRLSIIDLSSGQQPLYNEDGTVVVVYNGEIYNFKILADELKKCGHTFKTHCDTEVIVHAWEQWGEKCVDKFRGMFAFAIWDRNKKTLFLARDRLGIKPLHYAVLPNGQFIFASELKALCVCEKFSREIDTYAIEEYFALGYVPDPRTIYKIAKKLEPGFTLTLTPESKSIVPKQYWDVPFVPVDGDDEKEIAGELVRRLHEAVRIRMIADVPLGAFLSGGVDSSAVVAMMATELGDTPVNTCSISFGVPKYNESEFADMVARQYSTEHYVEQVDPNDFGLIDKLANIYDEPYADSSALPTYRVCELARKRVIVALSGDGGDENFAGYRRHRWHMNEEVIRKRIPAWFRRYAFGVMGEIYPKIDWAPKIFRAKSTLQSLARSSFESYMHTVSVMTDGVRKSIYSDSFRRELQGYNAVEIFKRHAKNCPVQDPLSLIQYIDMKTYLPGDILTKVDRASMAHSLEVRVPILDHEFVEWVSGLKPSSKLRNGEGKYIFKKSLESHLPDDILYRTKMGFGVPLEKWFRNELRDKVRSELLDGDLIETGYFKRKSLKRMVEDHQSGRREHSASIWALLMFNSFIRNVAS